MAVLSVAQLRGSHITWPCVAIAGTIPRRIPWGRYAKSCEAGTLPLEGVAPSRKELWEGGKLVAFLAACRIYRSTHTRPSVGN